MATLYMNMKKMEHLQNPLQEDECVDFGRVWTFSFKPSFQETDWGRGAGRMVAVNLLFRNSATITGL